MEWFGNVQFRDIQCHHTRDETPDPAAFPMHTHDEMEVYCFLAGRASYRVEGSVYTLSPGDWMLMRTAETHKLQVSPLQPYERTAIHFSPSVLAEDELLRPLLRPFLERPLGRLNQYHAADFKSDFPRRCLERLFSAPPDREPRQLLTYLLPILQECDQVFERRARTLAAQPQGDLSQQLVAYINLHLAEIGSVEELAARFFLSPSQLGRVFRRATGSSLWEYILIKRLFWARTLLKSGRSAGETARLCGFRDYSAFYRSYRRQFGGGPGQKSALPSADRRTE